VVEHACIYAATHAKRGQPAVQPRSSKKTGGAEEVQAAAYRVNSTRWPKTKD